MNIFQLNDSAGNSVGIIQTELAELIIQKEWSKFYKEAGGGVDLNEFEQVIAAKFHTFDTYRIFLTEIDP